jgi:hypothetical protein
MLMPARFDRAPRATTEATGPLSDYTDYTGSAAETFSSLSVANPVTHVSTHAPCERCRHAHWRTEKKRRVRAGELIPRSRRVVISTSRSHERSKGSGVMSETHTSDKNESVDIPAVVPEYVRPALLSTATRQ